MAASMRFVSFHLSSVLVLFFVKLCLHGGKMVTVAPYLLSNFSGRKSLFPTVLLAKVPGRKLKGLV